MRLGRTLMLSACAIAGGFVGLVIFGQTLPDAPRVAPIAPAAAPITAQRSATPSAARFVSTASAPLRPSAPTFLLAVPVAGVARETIEDSWGDPRDNGLRPHHGTDLMAPGGTLVTAAAPGMVEKLWTSAAGGMTLYVRSPGRDWVYYYAHLSGYAPGLHEGQAVNAGDPLGYVGDTGNAGPGNFHLHFGLSRTTPDQRWYQGVDVDPFPYLAGKPAYR